MIKVVTTLKKKQGMSTEAFRRYYEESHRKIGEKYLDGYASRYVRRYLQGMPNAGGVIQEPEFDVLLEIWFEDRAAFEACSLRLGEEAVAREIIADEEQLFDRSRKRSYTVEECESTLNSPATHG